MTPVPASQIELSLETSHPSLLVGLDALLRLGLISDAQIRRIAQEQLQCQLPVAPWLRPVGPPSAVEGKSLAAIEPDPLKQTGGRTGSQAWAQQPPQPAHTSTDLLTQLLQSLMAELSVLWLLLLGVFMVVVSSGVLAVIQWRHVSATGQYGILFTYTLAFWGAGIMLGQRPQLRLTARMVQMATVLIIPVNFWMMDEFALFQQDDSRGVAGIAAILLATLLGGLLKKSPPPHPVGPTPVLVFVSLGLCGLHWGWRWGFMPWVAPYVGTVSSCLALVYQDHHWRRTAPRRDEPDSSQRSLRWLLTPALAAVSGGTVLLLFRAAVVHHVPLSDLGLAWGLCGWLLCWLYRENVSHSLWGAGLGLLVAARLASLSAATPGPAIAISALALWVLILRVQRHRPTANRTSTQIVELALILATGLQALWPLRRLLPAELRQQMVAAAIQWAGSATGMPAALWGVTVFPYVLLMLGIAVRLRQHRQRRLALAAEQMALGLGSILTLVSVSNPLMRALNLLLSAATLILGIRSRPRPSRFLVSLTHVTGLAAIATTLNFVWPNRSLSTWAGLLTFATVVEWVMSGWAIRVSDSTATRRYHPLLWQQSTWHLGLMLAALSYVLLWSQPLQWGWLGLVPPVMLAGLGTRTQWRYPHLAAGLSAITLIAVQPLTFGAPVSRLLGFGLGGIVMVLNTDRLRYLVTAALTLGFGLSFGLAAIWQILAGELSFGLLCNLSAVAVLVLWVLRQGLGQSPTPLNRLYSRASDGWAGLLSLFTLGGLTGLLLWSYAHAIGFINLFPLSEPGIFLVAAILITIAIGYRTGQAPLELGWYGFAWGLEVSLIGVLALTHRPLTDWAIANLALGFLSQGWGTWQQQHSQRSHPVSWIVIPLIYAFLGLVLGHQSFTTTTGLYTLAAAMIGIGVGRRSGVWKGITYAALAGITIAAYELLLYPLLQLEGGPPVMALLS